MNKKRLALGIALVASLVSPLAALAQGRPPHAPPKEAFEACASAKEGDACTVTFGDHEIKGTCASFPGGESLACRPNGPPPGPPPGPAPRD
jgi:hypothetical protein